MITIKLYDITALLGIFVEANTCQNTRDLVRYPIRSVKMRHLQRVGIGAWIMWGNKKKLGTFHIMLQWLWVSPTVAAMASCILTYWAGWSVLGQFWGCYWSVLRIAVELPFSYGQPGLRETQHDYIGTDLCLRHPLTMNSLKIVFPFH